MEEFKQLLKQHDWYYQYSEDHMTYLRGVEEAFELQHHISGGGEAFEKLYNEQDPFNY